MNAFVCHVPGMTQNCLLIANKLKDLGKAMVYDDLEHYPKHSSSAGLQILFLFETGLRIGECCGLKWCDVKGNHLYISRQANNDGVKDKTKTASGFRDIPLTKEAQRILEDVKAFNKTHGFTAE